jgi:hypothetical protein
MLNRRSRYVVIASLLLITLAGVVSVMILFVHPFAEAMGAGCGGG